MTDIPRLTLAIFRAATDDGCNIRQGLLAVLCAYPNMTPKQFSDLVDGEARRCRAMAEIIAEEADELETVQLFMRGEIPLPYIE